LAVVPSAPTITATIISSTQINITITPSSNGGTPITSYKIYVNGSASAPGGTTATTSFTASGLSTGTLYNFSASAINSIGEGSQSTVVSLTIILPGAPTFSSNLWTSASAMTINFNAPAPNGCSPITSYNVYINNNNVGTTTTTSYQATGLAINTAYNITISAVNSIDEGPKSSNYTTTIALPGAPAISSTSAANKTGSFFNLTITPPSSNGGAVITSYNIYNNGAYFASTTSTSYTYNATSDVYTVASVTYNITVRAVTPFGQGSSSANLAVTVYQYVPPSA